MSSNATIYAALLGAVAAALFQYLVARRRLSAQRHAVRRAIQAEVGVLAELLRVQYRPAGLGRYGTAIARDPAARVFPIDPQLDYFTVYEGLSDRLGELAADHVTAIVQFYAFYKVAVGLASAGEDSTIDDAVIDLLLALSEKIAAFPDQ